MSSLQCNAINTAGISAITPASTFSLLTNVSGPINIGSSGTQTTTANGKLTSTGLLTASAGLTVSGSGATQLGTGGLTCNSAITLNTGYAVAPTAKTQLGCVISESSTTNTLSTNVFVSGNMTNIAYYNIGVGTWLITASYSPNIASTPASVSNQQLILNSASASGAGFRSQSSETIVVSTPSTLPWLNVSGVISSTSALTNVYLECALSYTGGSITIGSNLIYNATRIA